MTANAIFQISCAIAAIGWLVIILASPFWIAWDKFLVAIIITLLACIYSCLNLSNFHIHDLKMFGSLAGILTLYNNPFLLTAGWVHIMAFDLLVAVWIKKNSVQHSISHGLIILPLIFTCMLGPLGFVIYMLIRWFKTGKYFAANFV